ncbi:hypothetical protein [Arcobacter sp. LA11]|uniref:hypothetical protein n=1 Tax=Arcobacter sp. LA11 TaxID=1898176 RepID=UPI000934948D|nr:hypothetical protein [Arcobacter sp. LA11]
MSEESLINEYTSLNKELKKNDRFMQKLLALLFLFIFILLLIYVINIINSTNTEILNLSIFNSYTISEENILYFNITLYSTFFILLIFIFTVLYGLRKRDYLVSRILEISDLLNDTSSKASSKI